MVWLAQHNWVWALVAFALGALITWLQLVRRVAVAGTVPDTAGPAGVGTRVVQSEEPAAAPPEVEEAQADESGVATPLPPTITKTFDEGPGANVSPVLRPAARLGRSSLAGGAPDDARVEPDAEPDADSPELSEPNIPEGPYGEGSAEPLADGAAPNSSFTIKGDADSMLFHTPESPYYGRIKPEAWFDSESAARAAGFTRWDQR